MERIKNMKEKLRAFLQCQKERREAMLEKRRNSAFGQKMAPVYQWMNRYSVLLHVLLAVFLNFVIESISRHSVVAAWTYMVVRPWTFLFNSYIIFITFLLVYLTRRRIFIRIMIAVLWLIIGCANGYVLSYRVMPFSAQDLKVVYNFWEMLNRYFQLWEIGLLAIGILAVLFWLAVMWKCSGDYRGKMHRLPAVIVIVVLYGTIGMVTDLAIDQRVVSNYFGNITFAYQDYGLPYCFSASLLDTGIDQPTDYSQDKMNQITQNGKLTQFSTERSEDDMPNIIMLQLESFFDVSDVEFFKTSQDPIPMFHSLMENYTSGYLQVPSVGSGTANTEFEVLTGMSTRYFGPGEYPYETKAQYEPMESVATALKKFGYGAHALHNNEGIFYSRADVFHMMGFDTYTSREFMNILEYTEGGWATDAVLTEHIVNALDSTKQQDFVFGITVEGHSSYDHKLENPLIEVQGIEDENLKNQWEYYLTHLHATDQFLADLLKELEKREEPTVLILYGDHLPALNLKSQDLKSRYLLSTNYVIWDNIGLEHKDGTLASYQLMADVFAKLDIHSGTVFNYHQVRRQTKQYLLDLELLQYDMLYGECYVYGDKENAPTVNETFQMGVKDVLLTNIEVTTNGTYVLYGENMTVDSYIYVNGHKKKRPTFINDKRIESEDLNLEEGDIITISQLASNNRVFRTSAEYVYASGKLVLK